MRSKQEIEKAQLEIDEAIIRLRETGQFLVKDGIVDIDSYLKSSPKIMWVLKDVNSSEEDDDWDMKIAIKDLFTENGIKKGWDRTFNPIVYTTYGIQNNMLWDDIPNTNQKPEIIRCLNSISYINIKKNPGSSVSIYSELIAATDRFGEILVSQIELAEPEIIICGGTIDFIDRLLLDDTYIKFEGVPLIAYSNGKQIVIDANHPSARVNKENYTDNIVTTALKWLKSK